MCPIPGSLQIANNHISLIHSIMPKKPTLPATAQLRVPIELIERMFRLTRDKLNRSQFVTGTQKHRDPRYPPYAFTEHGVAMLSSVLGSDRAVQMNILIIRAF